MLTFQFFTNFTNIDRLKIREPCLIFYNSYISKSTKSTNLHSHKKSIFKESLTKEFRSFEKYHRFNVELACRVQYPILQSRSKCFNLSGRGRRTRSGRELLKKRPVAGNWNAASRSFRHGQLTISRRRILDADHSEFRFMDDASQALPGIRRWPRRRDAAWASGHPSYPLLNYHQHNLT